MYAIKKLLLLIIFSSFSILTAQNTKLFWADQMGGIIQSVKLDGTEMADLVTGLNQPIGLAIDRGTSPNKVYFCERNESRILKANLDGSNPEEVITGITGIHDIELDLVNRKIYWVRNTYADDAVQRADMDGLNLNIEDMYTSTSIGYGYYGVGLDRVNSKVYWTQAYNGCSDKISCINFDKTGFENVITYPENTLLNPWDIDVAGNKIYWTDCGLKEDIIYSANLDGSGIDTVLQEVDCQFFVIDSEIDKIYFSQGNYLESANLNGTDRDTIATGLGMFVMGIDFSNDAPSGLAEEELLVHTFELNQNYPNPFNPSTTIEFTLPQSEFTTLKVFNTLGQAVATLVSKNLNQGNHTYSFDGNNLASGIYYYQLVAGEYREIKKMILLR